MASLLQLSDSVVVHAFELRPDVTVIGRHSDCDICIKQPSVSSFHALIRARPGELGDGAADYEISDTNSTNGTFVNGERLNEPRLLNHGDHVRVGWHHFRFVEEDEDTLDMTSHMADTQPDI
ncbi:MAG: FHA domain-containing protein [Pseudomonadota bacterium]|nr:MAG: FHA domain-containing protein [Pseudomonadota bacterium]